MDKRIKKVAIYCRVAGESPFEIDLQKDLLTQYAHSWGYYELAYYMDNGTSGLVLDRPGFRQMEADIQDGGIGVVLVKDFARLGRDMWQALRWRNSVKRKGLAVLSMEQLGQPLISPQWKAFAKPMPAKASQKESRSNLSIAPTFPNVQCRYEHSTWSG